MRMPPPTEAEIHISLVQWLTECAPKGLVVHHSPSEGKRGFNAQRWLKRSGCRKGWPDFEFFYRGGAMFLELKRATSDSRLSPEQVKCHDDLALAGFVVQVARSVDEAQRKILEFVKSRRAHAA